MRKLPTEVPGVFPRALPLPSPCVFRISRSWRGSPQPRCPSVHSSLRGEGNLETAQTKGRHVPKGGTSLRVARGARGLGAGETGGEELPCQRPHLTPIRASLFSPFYSSSETAWQHPSLTLQPARAATSGGCRRLLPGSTVGTRNQSPRVRGTLPDHSLHLWNWLCLLLPSSPPCGPL